MLKRHLAAGLLAATLTGTAVTAFAWQRQDKVEVRAVRFYSPGNGQTSVLALIQVPYTLATPVGSGADAHLAYIVSVNIVDDKGKVYAKEDFQRHAPASFRVPGASGMEELRFLAKGGLYHMVVAVKDSATGATVTDTLHIEAYGDAPAASDLLLANSMRIAPAEDSSSLPGETSRGAFRFVTAPTVRIDLTHPEIAYMIEAYPAQDLTSSLTFSVRTPDGKVMAPLMPIPQKVPAGGGVLKGRFSLEGLPSGQYVMHASLKLGSQTIERETRFAVTETETALSSTMASANANRGTDEAYFNSLPEDSLDAAAEVLSLYGAPKQETDVYKRESMTIAAKRLFLIQFWQKHDLNKSTPENEERMRFYAQVSYANKNFGERGRPGWKTDRGRVFARFGAPQDSLAASADGKAPPYLVWLYRTGKGNWFIFGDRSNSNQYTLIKSNSNGFTGSGTVIETLTLEVSEKIAIWLGLDQCYFRKQEQLGGSSQVTSGGTTVTLGSTSMTCN
jgi:GWxTD domain-containing protein